MTHSDSQMTHSDSQMTHSDSQMTHSDSQMTHSNIKISQPKCQIINPKKLGKKIYICELCNASFTRKNNLTRHIKSTCKGTKEDKEAYKELYEIEKEKNSIIQKDKEELFKKIDKLIECVGNTTNITNNIVLNCYGSEDLSHITDTFKTNLLKLPYQMIPKLIEEIHFNQQKPENKNIYLPNKKQPFIKIYRNCKWEYKDRKETIKDLINTNYNRLEDHYYCKGKTELNNSQNNRYIDFVDKWGEHSELENEIEKKCEIIILNSGKKINKLTN